jgi:hypothetical protein
MMYRLGTGPHWFCEYGFNLYVDFCLWTLEVDGLQVPPFAHHPPGDGTLQFAGLDAAGWRAWTDDVVTGQYRQARAVRQPFMEETEQWWRSIQARGLSLDQIQDAGRQYMETVRQQSMASCAARAAQIQFPPAIWKGEPAVGQRLHELWEHYLPLSSTRQQWESPLKMQWSTWGDGTWKVLWTELQPYQTRLEGLALHLVEYAQEVEYLVPPASVILTLVGGRLDGASFRQRVLRAAEHLATHPSS